MKSIKTNIFISTLKDIHSKSENRKFCFIIGAGASKSAGISTGAELAERWYNEIEQRYEKADVETWEKDIQLNRNNLANSYGSIYRKRFENDKTSGYEFLVEEMQGINPTFGHIILAQILSKDFGHCVITTNFDSLVESAVYQYTDKTPLVCGHESLSGYARPSKLHPLIVKIHRDLLLDPKSDPDEIKKLDEAWEEPLDTIFSTHIPIVIGYGGNDGSLMSYLTDMKKTSNLFWCGRDENKLSDEIKKTVETHDGSFVKIEGFDEIMFELLKVFPEIGPITKELESITNKRVEEAKKQFETINSKPTSTNQMGFSKKLSAFEYDNLAENEMDLEKRKIIYEEALKEYPKAGWLWWNYTYFLHYELKNTTDLLQFYQKGLEYNLNEYGYIFNYANYLFLIQKKYTEAKKMYERALEIEPNSIEIIVNFGGLCYETRDYNKAEELFVRGLKIDNNSPILLGNYAHYLWEIKNEYKKAEEYYNKSLSLNLNDSNCLASYAQFLYNVNKNFVQSEVYFEKSLQIDSNNTYALERYSLFLHITRKYEKAIEYYKKSLEVNPKNGNILANYSQLLLIKGEKELATPMINESIELNKLEDDLTIELWFYRYAHYSEYIEEAEKKIEELLAKGVRSIDWDFKGNIDRAIQDGHPNPKKLRELADRITIENHESNK